ncbi:cysteine synthase family protein [candidate division WOR-3 bacterium]|nr:cysteine synthase family protein [candidate division WOR-3 bacterium]
MFKKYIFEAIGNTPLIKMKKMFMDEKIEVLAKTESRNPGGSIKDRAALFMLEMAEKKGELDKKKTILEATSGNMGISLSMIGAAKGYRVKVVMSEGVSDERKALIKALGAELILTSSELGTEGALREAKYIFKMNPDKYWFADQFNNPDNANSHYYGIAEELLAQSPETDFLIAGIGTSGTISGIARKFREKSPDTKIVGVIPDRGYGIHGLQNPFHDFAGELFNGKYVDEFIYASKEEAFKLSRDAAKKEGLLVGMSSGAALFAAKKITQKIQRGTVIVILPDSGEKYLSTELFR